MSGDCQREMTLQEWVDRLPKSHSARKEYAALISKVENSNSGGVAGEQGTANNAMHEIALYAKALRDSISLDNKSDIDYNLHRIEQLSA